MKKKENNLLTLIFMWILFAYAITLTACASSVFLSNFSINLLAAYHKCHLLIGYATHYLFCDSE